MEEQAPENLQASLVTHLGTQFDNTSWYRQLGGRCAYHLGMTGQDECMSPAGRGAPAKGHHTGFPESSSFGCHTEHTKGSRHSYIAPGCYGGPGKGRENSVNIAEVNASKGSLHTFPFDSSGKTS